MNWITPLLFAFSLSLRTPSVQPNPYDYEFSFSIAKQDTFYLNKQWERELGNYFVDEEYWWNQTYKSFSLKEKYFSKESHDLKYNQIDLKYNYKNIGIGYALRHVDMNKPTSNLIMSFRASQGFNLIVVNGNLSNTTEVLSNGFSFALSSKSEVRFMFNFLSNINLLGLYSYERYNSNVHYQLKFGLEYQFNKWR